MSAHTAPAPGASRTGSRRSTPVVVWLLGGLLAATAIVAATIALWPDSEADKARADGRQLGEAVTALYDAQSADEVDAALADVRTAVQHTADHAGDAVYNQVSDQGDALARAADGFVGSRTADDGFEQDLYQSELNTAIDDLNNQASDFQDEGPEVRQAFYDGYQEGLTIE
jgi:hypothetical protein